MKRFQFSSIRPNVRNNFLLCQSRTPGLPRTRKAGRCLVSSISISHAKESRKSAVGEGRGLATAFYPGVAWRSGKRSDAWVRAGQLNYCAMCVRQVLNFCAICMYRLRHKLKNSRKINPLLPLARKLHIICIVEMHNPPLQCNYRISLDLHRNKRALGQGQPTPTMIKQMPSQKSVGRPGPFDRGTTA